MSLPILPMRVAFDDTTENWQLWGQLVEDWICGIKTLPKDVKELIVQASDPEITKFSVPDFAPDENIRFYWYKETELEFWLPTEKMLKAARATIKSGEYPLPKFYDEAYDGDRADLTPDQDDLFAACRVGEYTINNCG